MVKRLLGRLYCWLSGWRFEGSVPEFRRYVLIAAPHTSNWDLSHMLAISWVMGFKVNWMGKKNLFKFPFGWVMRKLGGVPIDRSKRNNVVDQAAEMLRSADHMILVVPPEGTRSRRDYWKSGFYFIAKKAEVPIVLGFLDYSRKRGGIGPSVMPTDDVVADMDQLRDFYTCEMAKRPSKFSPPRLRAEDEQQAETTEDPVSDDTHDLDGSVEVPDTAATGVEKSEATRAAAEAQNA